MQWSSDMNTGVVIASPPLAKIVYQKKHESRLSIFRGSAGPQPLRLSRSPTMPGFSVKSFALFMW